MFTRMDTDKQVETPTSRLATHRGHITAAEIPKWIAKDDGRGRIVELRELVKCWTVWPDARAQMIMVPPRRLRGYHRFTARQYDLAKIAAVVHALCDRDNVAIPWWVFRHQAKRDVMLSSIMERQESEDIFDNPYVEILRSEAPAVCYYHRVWFSQVFIQSLSADT